MRMLTVLALMALCASVPTQVCAQEIEVGMKGGLHRSAMASDDDMDFHTVTRGGLGVFAVIPITRELGLQPEALLIRRATEWPSGAADAGLDLDYFEFPVLARVGSRATGLRPAAFVGPALSVLSHCELGNDPFGRDPSQPFLCSQSSGRSVRRHAVHVVIGGELDIPSGPARLHLDVRYERGLTSVVRDAHLGRRTSSLGLQAGVLVPLRLIIDDDTDPAH